MSTEANVTNSGAVAAPGTGPLLAVKPATLAIERIASDQANADRRLSFMPGTFPDGIEAADPMPIIHGAAYPVSFAERQ